MPMTTKPRIGKERKMHSSNLFIKVSVYLTKYEELYFIIKLN